MERKIAPKRSDPKKHTKKSQFDNMEVYRQLRTNIEYSSFNKDIQVICVTSSNPAEGKARSQAIWQQWRLQSTRRSC